MSLESDSDRLGMLTAFGETVTVAGNPITGLFSREYVELDGVESTHPTLLVRTSDIPWAGHQDSVVVNGTTFTIINIQNDGTGLTLLVLVV